ncbi:MAG: hypothetical protein AAF567_10065 [Actinomycetota bacterium]
MRAIRGVSVVAVILALLAVVLPLNGQDAAAQGDPPAVVPGRVAGSVEVASDGAPVFGIQVCVLNAFVGIEVCTFSGADGAFVIDGLPAGNYNVIASDLARRYTDGCVNGDCSVPGFIGLSTDDQVVGLEIFVDRIGGPSVAAGPTPTPTPTATATPTPTVTPTPDAGGGPDLSSALTPYLVGQLVDDGAPSAGVQVCAEPLASFFTSTCEQTDSNGYFVLDSLSSTNYRVVVGADIACVGVSSSSCSDAEIFGLGSSSTFTGLLIDLDDAGGGDDDDDDDAPSPTPTPTPTPSPTPMPTPTPTPMTGQLPFLAGHVTSNGSPLVAQVCAEPLAAFFASVCVQSDSSGRYVLEQLAAGNYTIEVANGLACYGPESSCEFATVFGIDETAAIDGLDIDVPDVPPCPNGFIFDGGAGACTQTEAAVASNAGVCPDGASGLAPSCFDFVAKGPGSAPSCFEGVLVGDQCVITSTTPPFDTGDGPVCPSGFAPANNACVVYVPAAEGAPSCPFGSTVIVTGDCLRTVAPVPALPGTLECAEPGAVLTGADCVWSVAPSEAYEACPAGYAQDALLDACVRTVAAVVSAGTRCPDGASGVAGGCFDFVAKGPAGPPQCIPPAQLELETCVVEGSPPQQGPINPFCDPGFSVVGPRCLRFEEPVRTPALCPVTSVETADGDCLRPVDDVATLPGALTCPIGVPRGSTCLIVAPAVFAEPAYPGAPCAPGFSLDTSLGGQCARFEPAAVDSAQFVCIDPAAQLVGSSCVWTAAPGVPGPPPEPVCPFGYSRDTSLGGVCARFEPARLVDDVYVCDDPAGAPIGENCVFTTDLLPPGIDPGGDPTITDGP